MSTLPTRPSLDQLKRQAKDLRKAALRADAKAVERVRRHHPDFAHDQDLAAFSLQQAQLVIAREYAFASWPKLVEACKSARPEETRTDSGSVPIELSDINADWLTDTLRKSGALPRGEVASFALTPCTDDVPLREHTAFLKLSYSPDTPANTPEKIYIRLNAHHGGRAAMALLEAAQDAGHPPVLPAYYGADYHRESGYSALLLQDLSTSHTKAVCYADIGGGHDLAGEIVDLMARFHAYWWQDPRLGGSDFAQGLWWGTDALFPVDYESRRIELQHLVADAKWLTGEDRQLCEELLRRLAPVWQTHFAPRLEKGHHITLVRRSVIEFADFLVPHYLQMVYDRAAGPLGQIFATVGSPCAHFAAQNLAQLFAQSWTPAQRGKREEGLLRRYWQTLCANGVDNYRWDDLWNDYRRMLPYCIFITIKHLVRLGAEQKEHHHLDLRLSHLLAAYRDLQVDEVFRV